MIDFFCDDDFGSGEDVVTYHECPKCHHKTLLVIYGIGFGFIGAMEVCDDPECEYENAIPDKKDE